MASFAGTTQKCTACEKKVYWVEQLTADNKVYHKSCFRCHHCKGTLKVRPNTGSFLIVSEFMLEGIPRIARVERSADQVQNNKVSRLFSGTQEKCVVCKKTVYPIEKVAVDGKSYHKSCFRCTHGGCVISPSNYVAHEHLLYCRHHHTQLFKQKGNFSQLVKHENLQLTTQNTTQHPTNGTATSPHDSS
ncbi:LIM domain-containing protein WLIM1-like [Vigna umbellata]|uniref:LIM domain-containing protein WLIM1-like n=1 Tax=Vigna umbellata TaxID=87088 RepID=UPI001F5F6560|nr:LIM domain-containing protein WLIM1-like [Vigna umbellata]